jgi:hypothetical protein
MSGGEWACPHCSRILGGSIVPRAVALHFLYEHERFEHPIAYAKHSPADTAAVRQAAESAQQGAGAMMICPGCGVLVASHNLAIHRSERCPKRPGAPRPIPYDETASRVLPPSKSRSEATAPKRSLRGVAIRKLSFELLPPGTWDIEDVIAHYRKAAKNPGPSLKGKVIQWDRLRELARMHPKTCYVGKEGWDGYVVFEFPNSTRAALECPIEGNATYIVSGNWKKKVGHSKLYLRSKCREFRARVFHRGDWVSRIEVALDRNRKK